MVCAQHSECDFWNPLEGTEKKAFRWTHLFFWYVSVLLDSQPLVMLVKGVGRRECGFRGTFVKIPPACSVVKMESDSSLQLGGRSGEGIKSITAACGLEACCRMENGSRTTSFSATRHVSKYYVMSEFNLHSSVLNFHCEGSVCSLMLPIYYPAVAKCITQSCWSC